GNEASLLYKQHTDLFRAVEREKLYIKLKELLDVHRMDMPESSISSLRSDNDWINFINMCGMKINEFYQSKQLMSQIKMYLFDNYNQDIHLEHAALTVNLSLKYLLSIFKLEFGVNFTEYITNIRMDKAKKLMKENTHALKEISFL